VHAVGDRCCCACPCGETADRSDKVDAGEGATDIDAADDEGAEEEEDDENEKKKEFEVG